MDSWEQATLEPRPRRLRAASRPATKLSWQRARLMPHQTPSAILYQKPIRSRTASMVSRANRRQ